MSFLSRIFGFGADPRDEYRSLWHRVVEIAREEEWYASLGVEDTVAGRFDMITTILSAVLVRMEKDDELARPSVFLTELFVEDMDGQLRESGVGDQVVGKHIGKLMATLGGRLGALRDALAAEGEDELAAYAKRNVTLSPEMDAIGFAKRLRAFAGQLAETPATEIAEGKLPW